MDQPSTSGRFAVGRPLPSSLVGCSSRATLRCAPAFVFASITPDTNSQLPSFPGARNRHQGGETPLQEAGRSDGGNGNVWRVARHGEVFDKQRGLLCVEVDYGKRRAYSSRPHDSADSSGGAAVHAEGFSMVEERQSHQDRLRGVFWDYFLPQGFPNTVAPQYGEYMFWRGVQYFFGGAISVFTTKSLLAAVGVTGRGSSETAAAINWVLKDGAGRLGRLLFARWGRELDCELKQFRLAGDLLMEAGAALELCTKWLPGMFLPLACTANLAKNLAAVAASSTRAPIYKTFALNNNMADITAKGESVANLADILGTLCGIALSRMHLPMVPTFCCLSLGYLVASRFEVDAVELPYLNRARLDYAVAKFIQTGTVPPVSETNHKEALLPWIGYTHNEVVLGATVAEACKGPEDLEHALREFRYERYVLTYRDDSEKLFVLLQEGATMLDCLKAMFCAHICLEFAKPTTPANCHFGPMLHRITVREAVHGGNLAPAVELANQMYAEFTKQACRTGWNLKCTVLNPRDVRLQQVHGIVF